MRLICTITRNQPQENGPHFSYFLHSQGIENVCEEIIDSESGEAFFQIWVAEEDQVEEAQKLYEEYQQDPKNPKYHIPYHQALKVETDTAAQSVQANEETPRIKRRGFFSSAPYGILTSSLLLAAILIFFWSQATRHNMTPPKVEGVAEAPVLSYVDRTLLFDYPYYFFLRDELLKIYTPEEIKKGEMPSEEAKTLIQTMKKTPYWQGLYEITVRFLLKKSSAPEWDAPLFEKIRQGEYWRLFTPALLHFDLLHIFFNLLWLIILGNQIENRLGFFRYLLFLLFVAVCSNTAQYFMSGSFFMGLSGIIVGMAGFIWARQQIAPWEGYLLHRITLLFLGIFVLGMFFLQIIFFILQITGALELSFPIANTAHLAGGVAGYALGRLPFFSLKKR